MFLNDKRRKLKVKMFKEFYEKDLDPSDLVDDLPLSS